jgi:hypothetical protein
MGEKRNTCRHLVIKQERKIPLVRSVYKREENIHMDITKISLSSITN